MLNNKAIGIIGAMDSETELLISKIDNVKKTNMINTTFYSGNINGKPVVVVTCGIGKVNAACITQAMIQKFDVGAVINSGVAGAISKQLKPCDIVVSSDLMYHDFVIDVPEFKSFEADKKLISAAEKACEENKEGYNYNYYTGRIATGDQFISDKKRKDEIVALCDPFCVEMEGCAIAHCCSINNIPFVVIRAISDSAEDGAMMTFYEFKQIASNISASIVLSILGNIN